MKEWAQREKERKRLYVYFILIVALAVSLFAIRWGMKSEAADEYYITTGGDPFTKVTQDGTITITNDETLTVNGVKNTDTIKWKLTDSNQNVVVIKSATGAAVSEFTGQNCRIEVKGIGSTPLSVMVNDQEILCTLKVAWGIDTSDQKVFQRVKSTDIDKVAILSMSGGASKYPSSAEISVGLKSATNLTWNSENENIVKVEPKPDTTVKTTTNSSIVVISVCIRLKSCVDRLL